MYVLSLEQKGGWEACVCIYIAQLTYRLEKFLRVDKRIHKLGNKIPWLAVVGDKSRHYIRLNFHFTHQWW